MIVATKKEIENCNSTLLVVFFFFAELNITECWFTYDECSIIWIKNLFYHYAHWNSKAKIYCHSIERLFPYLNCATWNQLRVKMGKSTRFYEKTKNKTLMIITVVVALFLVHYTVKQEMLFKSSLILFWTFLTSAVLLYISFQTYVSFGTLKFEMSCVSQFLLFWSPRANEFFCLI